MSFGSIVHRAVRRSFRNAKNLGRALGNLFSEDEASASRMARMAQSQKRSLLLTSITAIGGCGAFAAGCISIANAGDSKTPNVPWNQTSLHSAVGDTWASNRLQNDICHIAPGISEVLLDILDILQESCDSYVGSMKKRVNELENNLQKYASTMSLNITDEEAESVSLSDPGSLEIQRFRREYRSAFKKCNEMVAGLDKFLLSAEQFGAKTCIEKCDREVDEVMSLLENIERQVVHYERKLAMAEKHFHSRRRRVGVGHNKGHNDLKEKKG